ncbi:MAG: nickel pincer cofactor biosynthesis protein LarC [Peptococcaceae bacterium]|jgi:uncharacterized protein (TIGR00299 family) protein|nr:nickel pincer cofactor biosynthesis protein LarC [Peptococcaceae bacterium]MDH7524888.1 nickel pincer cofactor biosynthesis protein LarC [Peptococcaceae bacterium]
MKTAYFDCFSGASGNMIIGAFLDAGVPLAELEKELAGLDLDGEYKLVARPVIKSGLRATYFDVELAGHHHNHVGGGKNHGHRSVNRHHRNYPEIRALIESSRLSPAVKSLSLEILRRLGEAEAKVHGCDLQDVHFHEIGAVDTIIDITGAAFCLYYLGIEKICSSPLNVGSGMIKCAHGHMPVPAPATAELLIGSSFYSTSIRGELLTPTGAAIITTLTREFIPLPALTVETISYGAGTWDLEIPNVLRLFIGNMPSSYWETDTSTIIETTIDDMNPEFYSHMIDRLFQAGAVDVFMTPVYMKKNRPGTLITVTSNLPDHQPLLDIIFTESTTIGVRMHQAKRFKLSKSSHSVETPYGQVRIKLGLMGKEVKNIAPEYEDCRLLAEKAGVPLKNVYQEALSLAYRLFKE